MGRTGFISSYKCQSQSTVERRPCTHSNRTLQTGCGTQIVEESCLLPCSPHLAQPTSYTTHDCQPKGVTACSGLNLTHESFIKKRPPRVSLTAIERRHFFRRCSLIPGDPACAKETETLTRTNLFFLQLVL